MGIKNLPLFNPPPPKEGEEKKVRRGGEEGKVRRERKVRRRGGKKRIKIIKNLNIIYEIIKTFYKNKQKSTKR